jgi:hypothetical protein
MSNIPVILLAIASTISFHGCDSKDTRGHGIEAAEAQDRESEQYAKAGEEFAQANNAHWIKEEPWRERQLSTLSLQKTLIRADSRPIVTRVDVFDIERQGSLYRLRLHAPGLGSIFSKHHVFLDLMCSLEDSELEEIQNHLAGDFGTAMSLSFYSTGQFLVAAQIHKVQAHHHTVRAGNDGTVGESITFNATGECLQFEFQGEPLSHRPVAQRRGKIGQIVEFVKSAFAKEKQSGPPSPLQ